MAIVATLLALNVAGLRDRLVSAVGAGLRARPAEGTHGGVPLPKIESIAVLPLENLSRDPEQEYFADGMTDALITDLGKISALRVISRTSAMHYKGTKKRLPEIAKELNVDAIVEGTVQRSGDRVRITANLLHAPTDRHLWAESYERDLQDILTLQSEIAQAIAREVRVQLSKGGMCLAKIRPVNPHAHDAYLRGCFYWEMQTDEGQKKGMDHFQQAIALDPSYAPAYVGLARAYTGLGHPGDLPPAEAYTKAKASALKALELDDTLAEAHAALSYIKLNFEWDWVAAELEAKRAVDLNSGSVFAIRTYASYLMFAGKQDEAIAEGKRAYELDPFGPVTLAWIYANSTRFDDGIAHVRTEMERKETPLLPYFLTDLYARKGMCAEALAMAEKAQCEAGCGGSLAMCGKQALALKFARELERRSKREYVDPVHIAWIYAGLGDKEMTLKWYEEGYRKRSPMMLYLKIEAMIDRAHPYFQEPLDSDPRFQDLLRRMNFPK